MNNFENVDLTYYGEDVYITENREYHAMQNKIKKYLQFIVDTIINNELETKSIEANDFVLDIMDVIENISTVKNYDGVKNKIVVSNKYIVFDYFKKLDDEFILKKVIIDKELNEFNFISNQIDELVDITSYSFSNDGIEKNVYDDVQDIYMLDDDTISESLNEIKENRYSSKVI